jgi:hypothetical protein
MLYRPCYIAVVDFDRKKCTVEVALTRQSSGGVVNINIYDPRWRNRVSQHNVVLDEESPFTFKTNLEDDLEMTLTASEYWSELAFQFGDQSWETPVNQEEFADGFPDDGGSARCWPTQMQGGESGSGPEAVSILHASWIPRSNTDSI